MYASKVCLISTELYGKPAKNAAVLVNTQIIGYLFNFKHFSLYYNKHIKSYKPEAQATISNIQG